MKPINAANTKWPLTIIPITMIPPIRNTVRKLPALKSRQIKLKTQRDKYSTPIVPSTVKNGDIPPSKAIVTAPAESLL